MLVAMSASRKALLPAFRVLAEIMPAQDQTSFNLADSGW